MGGLLSLQRSGVRSTYSNKKEEAVASCPDAKSPSLEDSSSTADKAATSSTLTSSVHFCTNTNEVWDPCNAQWLMLYSTAAYASESPSGAEQSHLRSFFQDFPDLCVQEPGARCYSREVSRRPPQVTSRKELLMWLCSLENQCRKAMNQEEQQCDYSDLMKRWRYQDGYL